uniref:Uncharacterized protein n=1 Tax=Anguilla anguilla TaxID=7936 RepID=A0A0E9SFD4_ANGAN
MKKALSFEIFPRSIHSHCISSLARDPLQTPRGPQTPC